MTPRRDVSPHAARIMIVDDEPDNRELLKIMLNWEGFVTVMAESGEEAIAACVERAPELMLLDLMMPGVDGYEVALRMKKNPATKDVPIIVISAMTDRATQMRVFSAGAMDFVTKPIDRSELCQRVRCALSLETAGKAG